MRKKIFKIMAVCSVFLAFSAVHCLAQEEAEVNALILLPSENTAFSSEFQKFIASKGVRITDSYPPHVFAGYVPERLDGELRKKYGAETYRSKISDWSAFSMYGEKAVYAVNAWNKRFLEDPPSAPLVVSLKVEGENKKKDRLKLSWNEVMKAGAYRIQISTSGNFENLTLETLTPANEYSVLTAFFEDGVYYWRVAGLLGLNTGEEKEVPFSKPYSFAVSKTSKAPVFSGKTSSSYDPSPVMRGETLFWTPSRGAGYRLQVSEDESFSSLLFDVFSATPSYNFGGLAERADSSCYARVMPSTGRYAGVWSESAKIFREYPSEDKKNRKK